MLSTTPQLSPYQVATDASSVVVDYRDAPFPSQSSVYFVFIYYLLIFVALLLEEHQYHGLSRPLRSLASKCLRCGPSSGQVHKMIDQALTSFGFAALPWLCTCHRCAGWDSNAETGRVGIYSLEGLERCVGLQLP